MKNYVRSIEMRIYLLVIVVGIEVYCKTTIFQMHLDLYAVC